MYSGLTGFANNLCLMFNYCIWSKYEIMDVHCPRVYSNISTYLNQLFQCSFQNESLILRAGHAKFKIFYFLSDLTLQWWLRKPDFSKLSTQTISNWIRYFWYSLEFKNYRNEMWICIWSAKRKEITKILNCVTDPLWA